MQPGCHRGLGFLLRILVAILEQHSCHVWCLRYWKNVICRSEWVLVLTLVLFCRILIICRFSCGSKWAINLNHARSGCSKSTWKSTFIPVPTVASDPAGRITLWVAYLDFHLVMMKWHGQRPSTSNAALKLYWFNNSSSCSYSVLFDVMDFCCLALEQSFVVSVRAYEKNLSAHHGHTGLLSVLPLFIFL